MQTVNSVVILRTKFFGYLTGSIRTVIIHDQNMNIFQWKRKNIMHQFRQILRFIVSRDDHCDLHTISSKAAFMAASDSL